MPTDEETKTFLSLLLGKNISSPPPDMNLPACTLPGRLPFLCLVYNLHSVVYSFKPFDGSATSLHFYVGKYSKDSLYIEMESRLGSRNSLLPVAKKNSRVPDCRCAFQPNYLFLFPRRNHGMGDTSIKFEVIPGKNQKSEYVMTCGKHTVRGWCK